MATVGKQRYQCATCDRFIELPRVLDCGHVFCKRCYSHHHNEYVLHVLKPSRVKGHQEPPECVPCNVCQLMSRVPGSGAPEGVSDLLSYLRLESHNPSNPEINTRSKPEVKTKAHSGIKSKLKLLFASKSQSAVKNAQQSVDELGSPSNIKIGPSVGLQPGVLTTGQRSMSESQGVVISKTPTLRWNNTKYPHIYDSTFFSKDNIACITHDGRKMVGDRNKDGHWTLDNLQLRVLDIHGQETQLPFPVFLTSPLAVSGSLDGNSLAVVDWSGGNTYIIHVYSRMGTIWRASQITTTTRMVDRVSLAPSGDCLCGSADEMMLYNKRGELLWSIPLPGEGRYLPYLCITHSEQIIISGPRQDKITVHDMSGNEISEFPSQFVKKPRAICVDSRDQVLVMDAAIRKISLFSVDGGYIQPIMQKDVCNGMSLYLDKYLLMSTDDNGLYLYEL